MDRFSVSGAVALLLFLLLCGCANPMRPERDEWPRIGTELAHALRWGEFQAAATYVSDPARTAFTAAFPADGSLRITDARFEPGTAPHDAKAQGKLHLEYFRRSSISVKQTVIPLDWECSGGNAVRPCTWRIVTELQPLP